MEISQKSVGSIMNEVKDLQQRAQKAKGTPEYDADQKVYQQNFPIWRVK